MCFLDDVSVHLSSYEARPLRNFTISDIIGGQFFAWEIFVGPSLCHGIFPTPLTSMVSFLALVITLQMVLYYTVTALTISFQL
jgi:RsiW-degrading membrane proteinase PrsW (M82 family)